MTFLKVPWEIKITKWMWVITRLSLCFPRLFFFSQWFEKSEKEMVFGCFYEKSLFFSWRFKAKRIWRDKQKHSCLLSSEQCTQPWNIFLCSCANVDALSPWNAQPWGPAVCNPKPSLIQHSSATLPKFPEKIVAKVWGSPWCAIVQGKKKANTDNIVIV